MELALIAATTWPDVVMYGLGVFAFVAVMWILFK